MSGYDPFDVWPAPPGGGEGVSVHSQLTGRSAANAHPATAVSIDVEGITADDVAGAVAELAEYRDVLVAIFVGDLATLAGGVGGTYTPGVSFVAAATAAFPTGGVFCAWDGDGSNVSENGSYVHQGGGTWLRDDDPTEQWFGAQRNIGKVVTDLGVFNGGVTATYVLTTTDGTDRILDAVGGAGGGFTGFVEVANYVDSNITFTEGSATITLNDVQPLGGEMYASNTVLLRGQDDTSENGIYTLTGDAGPQTSLTIGARDETETAQAESDGIVLCRAYDGAELFIVEGTGGSYRYYRAGDRAHTVIAVTAVLDGNADTIAVDGTQTAVQGWTPDQYNRVLVCGGDNTGLWYTGDDPELPWRRLDWLAFMGGDGGNDDGTLVYPTNQTGRDYKLFFAWDGMSGIAPVTTAWSDVTAKPGAGNSFGGVTVNQVIDYAHEISGFDPATGTNSDCTALDLTADVLTLVNGNVLDDVCGVWYSAAGTTPWSRVGMPAVVLSRPANGDAFYSALYGGFPVDGEVWVKNLGSGYTPVPRVGFGVGGRYIQSADITGGYKPGPGDFVILNGESPINVVLSDDVGSRDHGAFLTIVRPRNSNVTHTVTVESGLYLNGVQNGTITLDGSVQSLILEVDQGGNWVTVMERSDTFDVVVQVTDPTVPLTTGDGKAFLPVTPKLRKTRLVGAQAFVTDASTSGAITVDLTRIDTDGTDPLDLLSTNLTIDANEYDSTTAATPAVVSLQLLDGAYMIRVDVDGAGTGAAGLMVVLTFGRWDAA